MKRSDKKRRGNVRRVRTLTSHSTKTQTPGTIPTKILHSSRFKTAGFIVFLFFIFSSLLLNAQSTRKYFKVAFDREYEPFEFVDDSNHVSGFTPELLRTLADKSNVNFEFIPMNWPEANSALQNGTVDLINMIVTPEREKVFDFSEPHSQITQALFRNTKQEGIKDTSSLKNKRVGFQDNDISLSYFSNERRFEKVIFDSKINGLLNLNTGEVDAFFCGEKSGISLISNYHFTNIQMAQGGLFPQKFAFAVRKKDSTLLSLLNSSLASIRKSGELHRLQQKWFSEKLKNPSWIEENKEYIFSGIAVLAIALTLFFLWNRSLKKMVSEKTKTLIESEEKFRQIAENINELFWVTDASKQEVNYVSPNYEKLWGRPLETLYKSPKSWLDSVHPDDKEPLKNAVINTSPGEVFDETFRIIHPDGKVRWLHNKAFAVANKKGEIYRIVGIAQDVTDRKQFEIELKDREEKSQSLLRISKALENANTYAQVNEIVYTEIIKLTEFRSTWIYLFNREKTECTLVTVQGTFAPKINNNYPTLKISGDPFLEEIAEATHIVIINNAETDPRTNKEIVSVLGNKTIINVPLMLIDHHLGTFGVGSFGEEGYKTISNSEKDFLNNIGAHVAAAIKRIQFISELTIVQNEVLINEERYRNLSEAAFDAIFITENGVIVDLNKTAEKMFGYSRDEFIGKSGIEFAAEKYKEVVLENVRTGSSLPYEAAAVRKDSSVFPCLVQGRSMRFKGKEVRIISISDITVQKEATEQLTLYKQIIDNSNDAIAIIDLEGRYIEQNSAHRDLIGFSDEELFMKSPAIHLGEEVFSRIVNELQKNGYYRDEVVSHTKTGDIDIDLSSFEVKDEKGEVLCYVGIKRNISDRKRNEEKILQQLDELRRWQSITLEREDRMLGLKHEVNELLQKLQLPNRYENI